MLKGLKSRLLFMNICAIMVIVIVITLFVNLFMFFEFNTYREKCVECEYSGICADISALLKNDAKDMAGLEQLARQVYNDENILLTVYDEEGRVFYDSVSLGHSETVELKHYFEKEYPLPYGDGNIGKLVLSSNNKFNDIEISYMKNISLIIAFVGVIIILVMIPVSNVISNKLGNPISDAINEADNLQRNEHIRKKLTQDMAHELRTPLAAIQGSLEAVMDGIWAMDDEKVKSCYDETKRLSELVSDISRLFSYESNDLYKTSFDIKELFHNVIGNYQSLLDKKSINVLLDIINVSIYADKEKLTQAFMNIISNAVNYTPECGSITIKTDLEGDGNVLVVAVSDTGSGVAEEDLPYIFERFYRADKSRNRKSGGSGVGLSIVKAIVEAHKGGITVESRLGEGTTFLLKLPCLDT